jgi:hypothetical protein
MDSKITERVRVTKHDENGRILEYEKHAIADVVDPSKPMPANWKPQSDYADRVRKVATAATLGSNVTLDSLLDFLGMFADANKKQNVIIAALVDRVKELEESQLRYQGIWNSEKQYPKNSLITHQGSGWISLVETRGTRPGEGNAIWRLAIKRAK